MLEGRGGTHIPAASAASSIAVADVVTKMVAVSHILPWLLQTLVHDSPREPRYQVMALLSGTSKALGCASALRLQRTVRCSRGRSPASLGAREGVV